MSKVIYEWDIELLEDGDIVDHDHATKLSPNFLAGLAEQESRLVLVRDIVDSRQGVIDRTWAYVSDGRLPECFLDAYDEPQTVVPERFHKELGQFK